jgi:CheY-like chemotaxis protein
MNFLIVEDDIIIQMFLEKIISDLGHQTVDIFNNSDDTLLFLDKHLPDFIMMDVGIDGKKDGIQTTQIINKKYKVPVVFLTGNSDPLTLKKIAEVDPFHLIKKPIDEIALIDELQFICNKLFDNSKSAHLIKNNKT